MPRSYLDFYPTPLKLAVAALSIPYLKGRVNSILDCGAGTGIWGQAAKQLNPDVKVDGVELNSTFNKPAEYRDWYNEDYLKFRAEHVYDLAVSNPPYYKIPGGQVTIAQKFIEHSLEQPCDLILFLVRTTFLSGSNRYELYKKYRPTLISHLVQRPSFENNKTERAMEYCLIVWDAQAMANVTYTQWLNWR